MNTREHEILQELVNKFYCFRKEPGWSGYRFYLVNNSKLASRIKELICSYCKKPQQLKDTDNFVSYGNYATVYWVSDDDACALIDAINTIE